VLYLPHITYISCDLTIRYDTAVFTCAQIPTAAITVQLTRQKLKIKLSERSTQTCETRGRTEVFRNSNPHLGNGTGRSDIWTDPDPEQRPNVTDSGICPFATCQLSHRVRWKSMEIIWEELENTVDCLILTLRKVKKWKLNPHLESDRNQNWITSTGSLLVYVYQVWSTSTHAFASYLADRRTHTHRITIPARPVQRRTGKNCWAWEQYWSALL